LCVCTIVFVNVNAHVFSNATIIIYISNTTHNRKNSNKIGKFECFILQYIDTTVSVLDVIHYCFKNITIPMEKNDKRRWIKK